MIPEDWCKNSFFPEFFLDFSGLPRWAVSTGNYEAGLRGAAGGRSAFLPFQKVGPGVS